MSTIATLTIDLVANSAKFVEGLQQADKKSKDWAKNVRESADIAAKAMIGAGTAVAGALTALVVKSAESADHLAKQADSIGITTEALAGLKYTADITGVSADQMATNMQKMTKNIGVAANTGVGPAAAAIKQLGLSVETLASMSPDQQLNAISDAMNNVSSRSQQAALAADIFGKSGVAMLNITDLGSEGLNKMSAEAASLGLSLSRVDAAKIEQMNDSFTRGEGLVSGFGLQLSAKIAPVITAIIDQTVEWANEQGGVGVVADRVFNAIKNGAAFSADAIGGMQVAWEYVKLAGLEVTDFLLAGAEKIYKAYLYVKSAITGEKINYEDTFLADLNRNADEQITLTKKKIDELAMAPLPSEAVNKFFDDAAKKADALAQKTADAAKKRIDENAYSDEDTAAKEAADKKAAREKELADAKAKRDAEQFARELDNVQQSLMTQEERLYDSYIRRSAIITEALQRDQITVDTYNQLQAENDKKYQDDKAALDLKNEAMKKKSLDNIARMQDSTNKAVSVAGKTAFLSQKVLATKEALVAGKVAIQKAWASAEFPNNLPAVALTSMATAANVAGIAGIAHGGMDNVPSESTYLLDKGERVLSPKQNTDLTGYLNRENSSGTSQSAQPMIVIVDSLDKAYEAIGTAKGRDAMIISLGKEADRFKSELKIA